MSQPLVPRSSSSGFPRGAEAILAEIRCVLLECKVCFEKFSSQENGRRPRNLPCGHVICLECVCALAHPVLSQLECPFCRRTCDVCGTYDCLAILDLQELLDSGPSQPAPVQPSQGLGIGSGPLGLHFAFGGWGTIINPAAVAILDPSMTMVVVHGGHEKVTIFNSQGHYVHSFGHYGHECSQLCHPLGVTVSPSGHIVVTDAGDTSVKVFTSRGRPLVTIFGPFELPWGVDMDSRGNILVTDAQAGTLWQIAMDFGCNAVLTKTVVLKGLRYPRAVASCRNSGRIAVVEHLEVPRRLKEEAAQTPRLKLFSKDFVLLTQVDVFSLNLTRSIKIDLSFVTFDQKGDAIVADSEHGMIWSLGDLQKTPTPSQLVRDGLVRPVGLVASEQNCLIVLDSGDHAVKIYSGGNDS